MKRHKILIFTVLVTLLLSLFCGAFAADWNEITDISGHWAEDVVKRGFEDGLLTGYDDNTVKPDEPITSAQMVSILTRVLGAAESADAGSLGISSDVWYYEAAGKALYLGLIDGSTGDLDKNMTRQNAFSMMARAFSLTPAQPDLSVLNSFSDAASLSEPNRAPMAALVSAGLVHGFDGSLNVNGNISRAEFLAVLYRVAGNYVSSYELNGSLQGGTMVKGGGTVSSLSIDGNLWFDCSVSSLYFNGLTAKNVTVRSHALSSLTLGAGTDLTTLVFDCGSGSLSPGPLSGVSLDTLRYQNGSGLALTDSVVKNIEITGSNLTASIGGKHESLIISGSNNTVTLPENAVIGKITVLGNGNKIEGDVTADSVEITGSKNNISLTGSLSASLILGGAENDVAVSGENDLPSVSLPGRACWLTMSYPEISTLNIAGNYSTVRKGGAGAVALLNLTGEGNAFILDSESSLATAAVTGASNKLTVNGSAESIKLDGRKTIVEGSGSAANLTINASGCSVTLKVSNLVDNGNELEIKRVLNLVTHTYAGNYTLKWAQEHDYTQDEKEIWINAKGHSSKTGYLIWINLSMQRVNIFKGSAENWSLEKSCIIGSGASGTSTPVGVYTTTYKLASGWNTATYTCRPVVGFKVNTGYAFHSRLYYPGTNKLKDASIGFPVSHGCIRMYDEDINYIYDNIPNGTAVVVY